jgi:xylulokinase
MSASHGQHLLLGIDAGTIAIKVCAVSSDGRVLARAQRAVPVVTAQPAWAEIDLELYWSLCCEAIREIATQHGPAIIGVGLATTCPTTILLDAQDRPLRPGIVFLDGRAQAILDEIIGPDPLATLTETGNRTSPSTCWAANLAWVRRHEPRVWAQTARIVTLNGFLSLRLAGVPVIDATQASYSGLMNVREREARWSAPLLARWQIDAALLPPIRPAFECIGSIAAQAASQTGLRAGLPLAPGAADTACAAFAIGLRDAGDAFESVGTSGVITFCLDEPRFEPSFLHRHHVIPGRWLAHGAMSTLGGAFGWLQGKVWPEVRSLAELEQMAMQSVPGANGLIFLPYLAGERSPIWDSAASAAWLGLRLHHTRADMVRAVFEGGALALRQILLRAHAHWGWQPDALVGVGGGAKSRFWAQIKADVLGLDYRMASSTDASAIGAALLAAIAAGQYASPQDPALPRLRVEDAVIQPGPAERRAIYARRFAVYDRLYPALSGAMHALDDTRA